MAVILEEVGPKITLEPVDQAPEPVSKTPRFTGKPSREKNLFLAGKGAANIIPGLPFATQYYQSAAENFLTKLLSPKPLPGVEVEPEKAAITKAIERIKPFEALTPDTISEQVIQEGTTMLGRLPFYIYTMGGMAKIPLLASHPVLSGAAGFGAVSGVEKVLEGEPGMAPEAAARGALTYPLLHGAGKLGLLGKNPLTRRLLTGAGFGGLSAAMAPEGEKISQAILGTGLGVAFPAGKKPAIKAQGATPENISKVADIIAERGRQTKFTGKPAQYPPMIPETVNPLAEQGRLNATLEAMEASQPRKAELDAAAEMPLHPAPKKITLEEVPAEVAPKKSEAVYHGTDVKPETIFKKGLKMPSGTTYGGSGYPGIFTSANKEYAKTFGKNIIEINTDKLNIIRSGNKTNDSIIDDFEKAAERGENLKPISDKYAKQGIDAVEMADGIIFLRDIKPSEIFPAKEEKISTAEQTIQGKPFKENPTGYKTKADFIRGIKSFGENGMPGGAADLIPLGKKLGWLSDAEATALKEKYKIPEPAGAKSVFATKSSFEEPADLDPAVAPAVKALHGLGIKTIDSAGGVEHVSLPDISYIGVDKLSPIQRKIAASLDFTVAKDTTPTLLNEAIGNKSPVLSPIGVKGEYLAFNQNGMTNKEVSAKWDSLIKAFDISKSQKGMVAKSIEEQAKAIKDIAAETNILEPNIRRILGVGEKEGIFTRVERGVYILKANNQDIAYVHNADSLDILPKLAEEGFKADMVFLDPPYDTPAVKGGNRGVKYELIKPEQFEKIVNNIANIIKDKDTPIIYMYSQAESGKAAMAKYNKIMTDYFVPVAKGEYQKTYKDGSPVKNMRGDVMKPEGIIVFTASGNFNPQDNPNFNFKMVRPKGYQTGKPVEMLEQMIKMTTKQGEVVLDPFAGKGTTGVAAIKTGRKAMLVEISKKAVEENIKPALEEAAKNIPGEVNKPRFTGKPAEPVSAKAPAAEAVAKPQAEPATPAPGKLKAPSRFPEDQTAELIKAAEAKGLVRRKGEKVQDMRLKNLLRHYSDASFDQMKDYISELTGTPKAPAKIFKLYGNIAQDTEAMKILNQVSGKWRDINKMETNTLDTPRIMEKVTGKDLWDDNILSDNTFGTIASADDAMFARLSKEIDDLTANKAGIVKGSKESAEIHRKLEAGEPLTPKEKAVGEYIHRKNDAWIAEANEMRDRLNKPRIPYRQKYYTHIIERNLLSDFFKGDEKAMGNISEGQLEAIRKGDYTKGNMPFNRFAQQRLGNKTKYDLIGNYETYLRTILREIYYTPAITHSRKFIEYSLVKQPNAYKAIDRMLNEMKGKPSELDKDILGIVASSRPIKYMRHKMSESALLGNLNFWAVNTSNFSTSYGELGNYMNKGLSKFLTDKTWRDFAFKNSSVLRQRTIDPDLDPSKFNQLQEMAGYITNIIEYNNVGSTYVGAYFKGKEQLGYSEAKAMKYADAIARRTQVGYKPYELNAWMRSNKGKVLSQFQTWSFNAMNHLIYDLGLGTIPKKVMAKFTGTVSEEPKIRWKAFLTLAATSMLMNALYKSMGLREPYSPTSALPRVPFVNTSRYEEPGVVKTIEDIKTATGFEDLMKAAEGQPVPEHKPGTKEKAAVRAGLRFVPGGTQIGRFIGGQVLPDNQGRFKGKSD